MERKWSGSGSNRWSDQGGSGSGRGGRWNRQTFRGRGGFGGRVNNFNRSDRCVDSEYDSCQKDMKGLSLEDSKAERNLGTWKEYQGGIWDNGPLPKEEPLKFEPPTSDVHRDAMMFMQELRNERKLFEDMRGGLIDCRGNHGIGIMCQFCDGNRGHWASNPEGCHSEGYFRRYQDSVINSLLACRKKITAVEEDKSGGKGEQTGEENFFRKKELGEDVVQDEEYGVSPISQSVVN